MAASTVEQIPSELIEQWAMYVDPYQITTFREACAKANMSTIQTVLCPLFASWTTSLMGSGFKRLKSLSRERHLRSLVDTIIIKDDADKLDPWTSSELPSTTSTYNIWLRNDAGIVETNNIGVADLKTMLHEKLLIPRTIKIRDYRIADDNFRLCQEVARAREIVKDLPNRGAAPVAAFAKELVHGNDLAMTSLAIRSVDLNLANDSPIHLARFQDGPEFHAISNPTVHEATIEIYSETQGKTPGLSMLCSAELTLAGEAASHWLEQIFYNAPALKVLKLFPKIPENWRFESSRVVPQLESFALKGCTIAAEQIFAMLVSSKTSLTYVCFGGIILEKGATWQEVLSLIAHEYQNLGEFSLQILREETGGALAVDFRKIKDDDVPEGLEFREKAPAHNKRITSLIYEGSSAGTVLDHLARCVQPGIPNEDDFDTGMRTYGQPFQGNQMQ